MELHMVPHQPHTVKRDIEDFALLCRVHGMCHCQVIAEYETYVVNCLTVWTFQVESNAISSRALEQALTCS
jgi:hypothetical protein